MSDAVGGARRCSRVAKTRFCFLCKKQVISGHKFVWVPVNELGYYRLQHRDCGFPDLYDHSTPQQKRYSAKMSEVFGRPLTPEQRELLCGAVDAMEGEQ